VFKFRSYRSRAQVSSGGAAAPAPNLRFRPQVEVFEDRTVPSAPAGHVSALAAPAAASAASLLPINITNVVVNTANGAITAVGTIGNQVFTAVGQISLAPAASGTTSILSLHLDEIHLDLLGLKVDTSKICLDITAQSGPGNLLGNLLTDVAGLLNSPTPPSIGSILGGLTTTQVNTLAGGLTDALNGAFGALGSPSAATGANSTTNILHLSLGPVDLNLLGLDVHLDNCNNGPVTVDISAEAGPGKLLGNLLTSVSHLLDSPAAGNALTNALNRVAGEINNLLR